MNDNTDALEEFISEIQAVWKEIPITLYIPANCFMRNDSNNYSKMIYLEEIPEVLDSEHINIYNDPDSFTQEVLDYIETCGLKLVQSSTSTSERGDEDAR